MPIPIMFMPAIMLMSAPGGTPIKPWPGNIGGIPMFIIGLGDIMGFKFIIGFIYIGFKFMKPGFI